jgi:hypothetical protein
MNLDAIELQLQKYIQEVQEEIKDYNKFLAHSSHPNPTHEWYYQGRYLFNHGYRCAMEKVLALLENEE